MAAMFSGDNALPMYYPAGGASVEGKSCHDMVAQKTFSFTHTETHISCNFACHSIYSV